MPSSTSNFDFKRPIPDLPWRGLLLTALLLTAIGTVAWEIQARAWGYAPGLNDTSDLWADQREKVKPDSIVVVGDSRALFGIDLDAVEKGFGQRPIQLALVGSCAYPILENLANDETFHGTVICSILPGVWLVPPPAPPYQNSLKALKRYEKRTVSQKASHQLGMLLEEHIAFMKQDDLVLAELIKKISVPDRTNLTERRILPPYFATIARDRRTMMVEACAQPGKLQDRVKFGWPPLLAPPKFPDFMPKEALEGMAAASEARFGETVTVVNKIRARGGKVVFVRFPHSGKLKEIEDMGTPRAGIWTRLMNETGVPNIYYSDFPELIFECPEWSHLSGPDSVKFTQNLVPHLKTALGK